MISVIIPAYNEEKVIKRTINSILKSNYDDYEIIVVDNGSTDSTVNIVKNIKSDKIRLFKYTRKRGPAAARNYGAKKARGDVLFFLDADDFIKKNTLKKINLMINKYKVNAIVAYRKPIFSNDYKIIWSYEYITTSDDIENKVLTNSKYCPYIIKKDFFNRMGGFNEDVYYFEDELFRDKLNKSNTRILQTNKIVYYTNMGDSFNDFYRRARNIGRGLVSLKDYYMISRVLLLNALFIYLIINPTFFLIYYLLFNAYWIKRSRKIIVGLTAPFLFILKKQIILYYFIKYLLYNL